MTIEQDFETVERLYRHALGTVPEDSAALAALARIRLAFGSETYRENQRQRKVIVALRAEVEELRGERDEALDDLARIRAEAASHKALAIENRVQTLEAARYWSDRDAQLRAGVERLNREAEANRRKAENERLEELNRAGSEELADTLAENERLREALCWYADGRAARPARAALHPEEETP